MNKIIRIDIRTKWSETVRVRASDGVVDIVLGPGDGLAFLANRWRGNKGPKYSAARKCCQDVLRGTEQPEVARLLFVDACREADLLI